jgi:hypothetical protein
VDFVKRNMFWLGIALSLVVLIVLYFIFVLPLRRDLAKSRQELEQGVIRLQGLLSGDIATENKIKMARKTAEVFRQQYAAVEAYFAAKREKMVEFWPEVILYGKVEPALFVVTYKEKTAALEESLEKDMKLGATVFQWKSFGDRLPEAKDCTPAMDDFRLIEHVAGLIRGSKAVTTLDKVRLGSKMDRPFLTVRNLSFTTRGLEISGSVYFPRLLFLIAELERSDKNIFVDTVTVKQIETQLQGEKEPPVSVSIKCSMLYGEKKQ